MQPGSRILGIDEAGRGPVIGPMLVCGFFVRTIEEHRRLLELPIDDSKALSRREREAVSEELFKFKHELIRVEPLQLDRENINALELDCTVRLVENFNPRVLIWDAPVAPGGIPKLLCTLRYRIGWRDSKQSPHIILENKADARYAACMAASILAKVTRDREIARLRERFGDFGSGYTSDPKTIGFLASRSGKKWGELSDHLRKKWSTLRRLELNQKTEDPVLVS